jgi:hypothetical protein
MILRLTVWWQTRPFWARAAMLFGAAYAASVAGGVVIYFG